MPLVLGALCILIASAVFVVCILPLLTLTATVTIVPPHALAGGTADLHWELGSIFSALRDDNEIRVIVLTGWPGEFYALGSPEFYDDPALRQYVSDPPRAWQTFTGILRTHWRTTRPPVPRSSVIVPRSTCSSPGSARAAR